MNMVMFHSYVKSPEGKTLRVSKFRVGFATKKDVATSLKGW